jgi:hypothetical protein
MDMIKYIAIGVIVVFAIFLLFINNTLATLLNTLIPGSAVWTYVTLLCAEAAATVYFLRGIFCGQKQLINEDTSPEAQQRYIAELTRRMKRNPAISQSQPGLDSDDPEYLPRCLAILKEKADTEIKECGERVFLASALAQNGRLDAIIVFISLCRLVWRISNIYNQRPYPNEILVLYRNVFATTFLAFSIEELDIGAEITASFNKIAHAVFPAVLHTGIPIVGNMTELVAKSMIDGAANCFLVLRVGIITRNAYAYGINAGNRPSRTQVFAEAGDVLYGMASGLVGRVTDTFTDSLADVAKSTGGKVIESGKAVVRNVGSATEKMVVEPARTIGQGVADSARNVARRLGFGSAKS